MGRSAEGLDPDADLVGVRGHPGAAGGRQDVRDPNPNAAEGAPVRRSGWAGQPRRALGLVDAARVQQNGHRGAPPSTPAGGQLCVPHVATVKRPSGGRAPSGGHVRASPSPTRPVIDPPRTTKGSGQRRGSSAAAK